MLLAKLLGHWVESLDYDYHIAPHCSRHQSPHATCTACLTSCPVDAISLENGKPFIDLESCIQCGDCVASCPVQAIEGFLPQWTFQDDRLIIDEDRLPTTKELLIYYKNGITTIVSEEKDIPSAWKETIDHVNQLLDELGEPPFQISCEPTDLSEDTTLSRRELFSLWETTLKKVGREMTPATWRFNHESLDLSQAFPDYQFIDISLDTTTCTVCGACEKLCPKECLTIDNNHFSIDAEQCTNCSLCQDICPEDAISLTQMIAPARTVDYQVYTKRCSRCEEAFETLHHENQLCLICKHRQQTQLASPSWLSQW